MMRKRWGKMGDVEGRPSLGTPEFARWLNGPITRFCGHGYHQDADHVLVCQGTVETLGIKSPCECECHRTGAGEGLADGDR